MNEFLEWLRDNKGVVLAGAAGLLLLSVVIGLFVGLSSREGARAPETKEGARTSGKSERLRAEVQSQDLPAPIVPDLDKEISAFSFVLDRSEAVLDAIDALPFRASALLKERALDLQPDVVPFVWGNEEFEVLMKNYEPSEP